MTKKCWFHCAKAQSNEDGIYCYKEGRVRVNGNDVCEDFEWICNDRK